MSWITDGQKWLDSSRNNKEEAMFVINRQTDRQMGSRQSHRLGAEINNKTREKTAVPIECKL